MSADKPAHLEATFPHPCQDHVSCLADVLSRARAAFDARSLRLTELRLRVFTQIAASHHAIGAYDIIDRLAETGPRLAPVSVYRAIEALMAAGIVHRLESRNAYFACHANHPGERQHVILSCGRCGTIAEIDDAGVFTALDAMASAQGFVPDARIVEVAGSCAHCLATGA
jgi:Fur family zinc uptake transcriptional regulator